MPAGKGNNNAVGHKSPRRGKKGMARMMSMPHEEWEAFKASCDLVAGRCIDDDEIYVKQWRALASQAVSQFVKANHGLVDPDVLIV